MKKSKLVPRAELRKLRRRVADAERYDWQWARQQIVGLQARVDAMERWIATLQQAATKNPEALHEMVVASLAPRGWE